MTHRGNLIAQAVLQQFAKLHPKRKPVIRTNGIHDWVPLSGIVAEREGTLTCLALATGMKCLPASKLQESNGVGIHDWHAEILAIRTFNRFLLDECHNLLQDGFESEVLTRTFEQTGGGRQVKPFGIRDDVKLHMYCSEAPCGDASMELTMAAQEDDSPWDTPAMKAAKSGRELDTSLPGRAYFSELGIVRRKPARPDAPPTLSKSCSDKIALKQCTSLLSSLTSLFVDPRNAYIHTLILPETQFSATACERAFSASGRMKQLVGKEWPGGYSFRAFTTGTTDHEFDYSKRSVMSRSDKISTSNLAAAWSHSGVEETLLAGVVRGRKPFAVNGASCMSRRSMWETSRHLAEHLGQRYSDLARYLGAGAYKEVKEGELLTDRRKVKEDVRTTALAGWVRNIGGSDFGLERHGIS